MNAPHIDTIDEILRSARRTVGYAPEEHRLEIFTKQIAETIACGFDKDRVVDHSQHTAELFGLTDKHGADAIQAALARGVSEGEAKRRTGLLIQSSADFIGGFVPPDYLVDGILQKRFIYSLTGRTGSGKTAIILLLAASVALGRPIGTHDVQKGTVLYFAGENPDDIRMRWIAMATHLDFDVAGIDVSFIPGTFKISEMAERIIEEAQTAGPFVLVIIDTSAAYFEGDDENNNPQQGAHARRLRSLVGILGAPCIVVGCHPTKNAGDENLSPRGGGAFIAEMDGNLTAIKGDGSVELHWQSKFRGPDFAPISFALHTVTDQRLVDTRERTIPTVMAAHLSEAAKAEITARARSNENLLLAAIANDDRASMAELARRLSWFLSSGDPHKMMVQRARQKLIDAKLLTLERDRTIVTDKGKKVLAESVTGERPPIGTNSSP